MSRTTFVLGVFVVLLTASGCTMCCHPYDYCGPVYHDDCCQSCYTTARSGSILAGTPEPLSTSSSTAELAKHRKHGKATATRIASNTTMERKTRADYQSGDVAGSERIVSVTDRVVSTTADSPNGTSTKSWTARRPTNDYAR